MYETWTYGGAKARPLESSSLLAGVPSAKIQPLKTLLRPGFQLEAAPEGAARSPASSVSYTTERPTGCRASARRILLYKEA